MTPSDIQTAIESALEAAITVDHWVIAPGTVRHRPFLQCVADRQDAGAVAESIALVEGRIAEVHTIAGGKLTSVTRHHPSGACERRAIFRDGGLIGGVVL